MSNVSDQVRSWSEMLDNHQSINQSGKVLLQEQSVDKCLFLIRVQDNFILKVPFSTVQIALMSWYRRHVYIDLCIHVYADTQLRNLSLPSVRQGIHDECLRFKGICDEFISVYINIIHLSLVSSNLNVFFVSIISDKVILLMEIIFRNVRCLWCIQDKVHRLGWVLKLLMRNIILEVFKSF